MLSFAGLVFDAFIDPNSPPPWYLIGLPPAAVALVFYAFYIFAIKLDKLGIILGLVSCLAAILMNNGGDKIVSRSSQWVFPLFMAIGGLITYIDSKRIKPYSNYSSNARKSGDMSDEEIVKRIGIPMWVGVFMLFVWIGTLAGVIIATKVLNIQNVYLEIFEVMYRIGSIIYGGGQVVLPMLQDEVVPQWMTSEQFLQGLGLASSMPGPLFNFAAYCGAIYRGVPGAFIGNVGLFSPGIILIFAIMPFWVKLRHNITFRAILSGVNSSAIGLVGAACVILWETAIITTADAMVFSIALTFHVSFHVSAPFIIVTGFIVGAILSPDALNLGQVPYCS